MKDGPTRTVVNYLTPFIPRRPGVSVSRENPGFLNVKVRETIGAQQAPNFSNNDSLTVGVGRDSAHDGSYAQVPINWTPVTAHAWAMRPFGTPIRNVRELQTAVVKVGGQRGPQGRKPVDTPPTLDTSSQYALQAQNYYPNLTNLG